MKRRTCPPVEREGNGRIIDSPKTGCLLVDAGLLREVSIVVLGADAGTSLSSAASQEKEQCMSADTATPTTDEIRAPGVAKSERIEMIQAV